MSERRDFVLRAPIGRTIWSLSWPIILSNELTVATSGLLLFWLGRLVGEPGLVVDSLFRPFGLLVLWGFGAPAIGASALVSISVGAADRRGLSIAAGALTLTVALSLALAIVVVPISPWLADVLAGDLPVTRPMWHYLIGFLLVAVPALSISEVLLEVVNSTGATTFNLVRIVVDLIVMAALTPILIELVGFGIAGGPISEGIAALGLAVVLWLAMFRRRSLGELGELARGDWGIRWALWKEILVIGVPGQVGRITMFVAQLVLIQLVARDGAASVAGYGIAGTLMFFGAMATLAIAQGGAISIGQALGAELHDRARSGIRTTLIVGWSIMAVFVIATLFDRPMIELFTSDPAIVAAGEHALSILRWGGFGIATWQILLACFAAHRKTVRAGMLMIAGELVGIGVAFAWPGSYLDAVAIAFVAANVLKAVLLLGLLATGALAKA